MVKSFKITEEIKYKMVRQYKDYAVSPPQYASHAFKLSYFSIVIYDSLKVVFNGDFSDEDVDQWINHTAYYETNIIGSDEVGTGDFFGPIIVCAAYISENDLNKIKSLNIIDSKNLKDDRIIELASKLIGFINYRTVECNNDKYNDLYSKGYNIKQILAIMHKKAIDSLEMDVKVVIDQFIPKASFEKYVNSNVKYEFETKGESKYIAIAVASIIARALFIKRMDEVAKQLEIPKVMYGAGVECEKFALMLFKRHGSDKMVSYVKRNFKNYERIMEVL